LSSMLLFSSIIVGVVNGSVDIYVCCDDVV